MNEKLSADFLDYLNQRLEKKNIELDRADERTRVLLKTERAELEVIRNKYLSLLKNVC